MKRVEFAPAVLLGFGVGGIVTAGILRRGLLEEKIAFNCRGSVMRDSAGKVAAMIKLAMSASGNVKSRSSASGEG